MPDPVCSKFRRKCDYAYQSRAITKNMTARQTMCISVFVFLLVIGTTLCFDVTSILRIVKKNSNDNNNNNNNNNNNHQNHGTVTAEEATISTAAISLPVVFLKKLWMQVVPDVTNVGILQNHYSLHDDVHHHYHNHHHHNTSIERYRERSRQFMNGRLSASNNKGLRGRRRIFRRRLQQQQQQQLDNERQQQQQRKQEQSSSSSSLTKRKKATSSTTVRNNEEEELDRPLMYTYYEPAKTDMTEEADEYLLTNWKKAWWDAGWQPRILTENDARMLPDYDQLVELVVDTKHIGTYNMACYIRWLAMAAVGGGFMSDYDTFPLNHFLRNGRELPFDGQLTVWSGHVPALVSGSGPEYHRLAKRIGHSIQEHVYEQQHINNYGPSHAYRHHLPWSDMLALSELYNKVSKDMFIMKRSVLNGADALQKLHWSVEDCVMSEGMRAVHFSHKAVADGQQAYRGAIHRGTIARQFLNMWHQTCHPEPIKDDLLEGAAAAAVSQEEISLSGGGG